MWRSEVALAEGRFPPKTLGKSKAEADDEHKLEQKIAEGGGSADGRPPPKPPGLRQGQVEVVSVQGRFPEEDLQSRRGRERKRAVENDENKPEQRQDEAVEAEAI